MPAGPEAGLTADASEIEKVTSGPCYDELEACSKTNPPPAGAIVTVYIAPKKPNGEPDMNQAQPVHACKSNGDGTYESKNGFSQDVKEDATWDEAIGGYENPPPSPGGQSQAVVGVVKCFAKTGGC